MQDIHLYGIDWDGPLSYDEESEDIVTVPKCECPLTSAQLQVLHDEVPPLSSNENYGIDTFLQVLQFIKTQNYFQTSN